MDDPVFLIFVGAMVLLALVRLVVYYVWFLRLPKPRGVPDEIVTTLGARYKLMRKIKSPVDGRVVAWEAVDDYGKTMRFDPAFVGVRRAR